MNGHHKRPVTDGSLSGSQSRTERMCIKRYFPKAIATAPRGAVIAIAGVASRERHRRPRRRFAANGRSIDDLVPQTGSARDHDARGPIGRERARRLAG